MSHDKKRNFSARDTALIIKYPAHSHNHKNYGDESVNADDIDVSDVDTKLHHRIRDMLRKHENMWNGLLGHKIVIKNPFELTDGSSPFESTHTSFDGLQPNLKPAKSKNEFTQV